MPITSKCPKCGQQLHAVRINLMLVGIGCTNPDCLFHGVIPSQQEPSPKYFAPQYEYPTL
jgi:ssDNA-binding Zn-finger/Zn-ribbon topoisomerase 1